MIVFNRKRRLDLGQRVPVLINGLSDDKTASASQNEAHAPAGERILSSG
jgi:hypothetical protein